MTAKVALPSLTEGGWIKASIPVADMLMSHMFCSDYSQTYLYTNRVTSMAWLIREYQDNTDVLMSRIERSWTEYFGRYFNDVVVEVTQTSASVLSSKVELNIYLSFTDIEGVEHNFARLVEYEDLIITKVIDILTGRVLQI